MRNTCLPAFLLALTLLIGGCNRKNKTPDVSNIPMHVSLSRFDRELMALDTAHLQEGLKKLQHKYPAFFPVYMNRIMNFQYSTDSGKTSGSLKYIRKFVESKDIRALQDTINAHFPPKKMQQIKAGLKKSFQYLKYYFPKFKPPRIVTFESGLANFGAITVDSVLGIGLDMFLGEDFPLYKKVANPYPVYILKRFSSNNIVISCIKVLLRKKYALKQGKGTLLDYMIGRGKILYCLDKVLPDTPDRLIINYTKKQWDWCKKNEQFIWQYFVHNNLLYNDQRLTIREYIGPGPSSRGMPKKAPGNTGSWIGWQIVQKYMQAMPQTSLVELMKLTNSQKILTLSNYHPH